MALPSFEFKDQAGPQRSGFDYSRPLTSQQRCFLAFIRVCTPSAIILTSDQMETFALGHPYGMYFVLLSTCLSIFEAVGTK